MGDDHRRSLEVYIQYIERSGHSTGVYRRWRIKHISLLDRIKESMGGGDSNIISFLLSGSP